MAGQQGVGNLISKFNSGPASLEEQKHSVKNRCQKYQDVSKKILKSRFMAFVFGPAYGLFIYLYITHLILAGAPFTREGPENSKLNESQSPEDDQIANSTEPEFTPLMTIETSHMIGRRAGAGVGLGLTVSSLFSHRLRCSLTLMIPSLVAKRGRSFMLTFAMGLLIKGPVDTIQFNLQELVRCFTCMYEEIKKVAERFQSTFKGLMVDTKAVFEEIENMTQQTKDTLEEQLNKVEGEQKAAIQKAKKEMKEQSEKVNKAVRKFKEKANAPGKFIDGACGEVKQVVSTIAGGATDIFNTIHDGFWSVFGRRKRSSCGIPNLVDIPGMKEPDLAVSEKLKALIKKVRPDINLLDFDLSGMKGEIDASSIKNIRSRMKAIFDNLMSMLKSIARNWSKIFYLTILAVVVDAIQYQKHYCTDDEFDNKMVDGNLKRMWKEDGLRKLTPLRNWEVKKQEAQMSTSLKMTREELQRLVTQSFPVILSSVVFLAIIILDFLFAATLQVFEKEAKFGIVFPGMEQGMSFSDFMDNSVSVKGDLKIEAFNLSTDPCLPRSRQTDGSSLGPIFTIMVVCLLSCLIDAYFSRLRAQICNLFFPLRADERAKYLYK